MHCHKNYPIPENAERLNAPRVNPEIWRIIESRTRSKDVKLQKLQQYVLRSVVPILQVNDTLIASRESHVSLNMEELITKLVDAVLLRLVMGTLLHTGANC